jgi:hypothetical protein
MKSFNSFINERRRIEKTKGPQPKYSESGHDAALEYLKGKDLKKYGVSMTNLPKIGVNPQSKYDTPIGIYFYPAEYYVDKLKSNKELDFQHRAKYINILKFNTDKILYLDDISWLDVSKLIQKLKSILKNYSENIDKFVEEAEDNAIVSSEEGGQFWYVLYSLADLISKTSKSKSSVIWNWLIRKLGYDIVIDSGKGIIHSNEPHQGFIANPVGSYSLATRIENIPQELTFRKRLNSPGVSDDEKIAILADKPALFQFMKNPSEYVQKEFTKEYGYLIKWIKNPSLDVQMAAVKTDPYNIQEIENPHPEVQKYIIDKDIKYFKYIQNPTQEVIKIFHDTLDKKFGSKK